MWKADLEFLLGGKDLFPGIGNGIAVIATIASSVDLSDLDAARRSYIRSLKELGSVLDRLIEGPALTDVVEREEYGRTENDR